MSCNLDFGLSFLSAILVWKTEEQQQGISDGGK